MNMMPSTTVEFLAYLQIASPTLLISVTFVLTIYRVFKDRGQDQFLCQAHASQWLSMTIQVIYVCDAILFTANVFVHWAEDWQHRESIAVSLFDIYDTCLALTVHKRHISLLLLLCTS